MATIPPDLEISRAVQALFNATASFDLIARRNALVPTDAGLSPPPPLPQGKEPPVTYVPSLMSRELLDFVNYFGNLIGSSKQIDENAVRVMLVVYCHIMESELWPTLIWNQLRLLAGEQPSWRFTRTNSGGKTYVCEYPREKFAEISTLAKRVEQPIGDIISLIWDGNLRNAFSHSGYLLTPAYVIPSCSLSPISRKGSIGGNSRSYSFDEIRDRYRSAKNLLFAVYSEYSKACNAFSQ